MLPPTPILGLLQFEATDSFEEDQVNQNFQAVEDAIVNKVATSTTRPTSGIYTGYRIYETDTGFVMEYTGTGWARAFLPGGTLGTKALDSVKQPGIYYQTAPANVTVGNNYPAEAVNTRTGMLEVGSTPSSAAQLVWQRYTDSALNCWIRYMGTDGIWRAWVQSSTNDWTTFTPAWTGMPTPTTNIGKYKRIGKKVNVRVDAVMAGAPTAGVVLTLPLPAIGSAGVSTLLGTMHTKDASAGIYTSGVLLQDGAASITTARLMTPATSTNTNLTQITATSPFSWTAGDSISIICEYETP